MNVAIYARGPFHQTEILPAWCNWACHYALPKWDEDAGLLVEPYLPHTPIGIMHLTVQKRPQASLTTLTGKTAEISLTFPGRPIKITHPPVNLQTSNSASSLSETH